jgi:hypothetical protein
MATLTEKTIDALHCSGAALEQYEKFYQEKKASEDALNKVIPRTVKAVLAAGLIDQTEVKDFERVLKSPEKTAEFLGRVANHHAEALSQVKAAEKDTVNTSMGKPIDKVNGKIKKASFNTGGKTAEPSEAVLEYCRQAGVVIPD